MIAALLALAAALGLAIGSFLNVVVHRVPRGLSVVRPRSSCPHCGSPIRSRDNVPIVSWIILGGRCRVCRSPISLRYPLIEAGTAVAFVGVLVRFVVADDLPSAVPAYLYLAAIGVALALIDIEVHRLPDAIVLPAYPVLGTLLVLASWGSGEWSGVPRAAIGGAGLLLTYLALAVAKPGGMGYGDVKLAGVLGMALAWLGWGELAVGAFGAFLLGGAYSIVLLATRRARRGTGIPFGPWMLAGAAGGVAVGGVIWSGYLGLFA